MSVQSEITRINSEVTEQTALIEEIEKILENKAKAALEGWTIGTTTISSQTYVPGVSRKVTIGGEGFVIEELTNVPSQMYVSITSGGMPVAKFLLTNEGAVYSTREMSKLPFGAIDSQANCYMFLMPGDLMHNFDGYKVQYAYSNGMSLISGAGGSASLEGWTTGEVQVQDGNGKYPDISFSVPSDGRRTCYFLLPGLTEVPDMMYVNLTDANDYNFDAPDVPGVPVPIVIEREYMYVKSTNTFLSNITIDKTFLVMPYVTQNGVVFALGRVNSENLPMAKYSYNITVNKYTPELQEKTVTPGAAAKEVTPDSGYNALGKVTVMPRPYVVNSITATGSYTDAAHQQGYWAAITNDGHLLITVKGGTSTAYESIYFTNASSDVTFVGQSYYSYASMTAGQMYVAVYSGIKSDVNITLKFNSRNSSSDYVECAVTIAYV